jgi:hypothetical protein
MSSHREAPGISQDPVADNTDTYAFVSPDDPTTVTIITNYVPLEGPPGGPNFFEFGDDVLYQIYIDNDGDALPEITYSFLFNTTYQNPNTFLYNTGPITSLTSGTWNKRQFYNVMVRRDNDGKGKPKKQKHDHDGQGTMIGSNLACPPCNIGPRSTPNYQTALADHAVHVLPTGETVFAGQRRDGFYVDLGATFDLADIRPIQHLHLIPTPDAPAHDPLVGFNVHTIALKVPIHMLTSDGSVPSDPMSTKAVLGVWGAASRRKVTVRDPEKNGTDPKKSGPWVQVSRLANPLFNEVIVPIGQKDYWNSADPVDDSQFAEYVKKPELQTLLPILYPGQFPHLAGITGDRGDLVAILLTGIPSGLIGGFQNSTGSTLADMLRLNVAIPPASSPSLFGILGGDLAGFPNGRRVFDDIVTIELQAIAGATYPLVNPSYVKDAAIPAVQSYITPDPSRYKTAFPYLGTPLDGFSTP